MTLPSRHRIRNLGGLSPEAEHVTSGWGRNVFVSFKPPRPGNERRVPTWKVEVLATTLGPQFPSVRLTFARKQCATANNHHLIAIIFVVHPTSRSAMPDIVPLVLEGSHLLRDICILAYFGMLNFTHVPSITNEDKTVILYSAMVWYSGDIDSRLIPWARHCVMEKNGWNNWCKQRRYVTPTCHATPCTVSDIMNMVNFCQ